MMFERNGNVFKLQMVSHHGNVTYFILTETLQFMQDKRVIEKRIIQIQTINSQTFKLNHISNNLVCRKNINHLIVQSSCNQMVLSTGSCDCLPKKY